MTEQERREAAKGNTFMASQIVGYVEELSPEPIPCIVAILTAATVMIEEQFGRDRAAAALVALVEPTLKSWGKAR